MKKNIVAVGSVAFDSVQTPKGKRERILGGSLTHFMNAVSLFSELSCGIIGVVGDDFEESHWNFFKEKNIDIQDLKKKPGKTFFWEGYYEKDMNQAHTLKTELNVFGDFNPEISSANTQTDFLFLGNIDPALQLQVLDRVKFQYCLMDTMNFWLETRLEEVKKAIQKISGLIINEGEAALLTGEHSYLAAGEKLISQGLPFLIIKRGSSGVSFFSKQGDFYSFPAYPVKNLVDPTGAGDSFAGGFVSYLAQVLKKGKEPLSHLKEALVYATITASFYVEGFGIEGLAQKNREDIFSRIESFKKFSSFPNFN